MNRPLRYFAFQVARKSLPSVLAVLWSVPAWAIVPTSCTDFKRLHDEIYRLTNGRPTYLPMYGGSPVSPPDNPPDPLVNHTRDFYYSAFYNKIDPRFLAAIGRQESGLGTADPDHTGGTTEEIRDNFIGWQAGPGGKYQNFYRIGGGMVTVDELITAINTAFSGGGDTVPLPAYTPTPDACDACFNTSENQYDCGYCQPTCGDPACDFCLVSCTPGPCATCISAETHNFDCETCAGYPPHCGDLNCTYCEDNCATPTPTPPPTPTFTPTPICTCGAYPCGGNLPNTYDCEDLCTYGYVERPLVAQSITITQSNQCDPIPVTP